MNSRILVVLSAVIWFLFLFYIILSAAYAADLPDGWERMTGTELQESAEFLRGYEIVCKPYAGVKNNMDMAFIKAEKESGKKVLLLIQKMKVGYKIGEWELGRKK